MSVSVTQSINLYRPQGNGWFAEIRLATMGWLLLAIVVGAALVSATLWMRERRFEFDVSQVVVDNAQRVTQLSTLGAAVLGTGQFAALQQRVAMLEQRNARLQLVLARLDDATLGQRAGYSRALAEVARASVDGVWISHIAISADDSGLELRGNAERADLLPAYIQSLQHQSALLGRGIDSFVLDPARRTLPTTVRPSVSWCRNHRRSTRPQRCLES